MKRVAIALVALLAVVGLCVVSLWKLETTHDRLMEEITYLEKLYENKSTDECPKKAADLRDKVEKQTFWMTLFFHQNCIKEIAESVQLAAIYSEEESWEDFRAQLQRCHHALDEIYSMEFPTWSSIF